MACVVAAATFALLASAPKREPVSIRLVGPTTEYPIKGLVFEGTNGLSTTIVCEFFYSFDIDHITAATIIRDSGSVFGYPLVRPGATFRWVIKAPPKDAACIVKWYEIEVSKRVTRWDVIRTDCYSFLKQHGMPMLARPFEPRIRTHTIPSTEIKE